MPLANSAVHVVGCWFAAAASTLAPAANSQELRPYTVVGDAIPDSLTGATGDIARGRALLVDRISTCILCHSGPFPEAKFQGDLAPGLAGAGSRWSEGQLRLRLVDASVLNPATIMPSYYRLDGLVRVGAAWRGKPILSAEQIEDLVAYLATLRDYGKQNRQCTSRTSPRVEDSSALQAVRRCWAQFRW
jgi:sulfur-oxidizing protein SoxX